VRRFRAASVARQGQSWEPRQQRREIRILYSQPEEAPASLMRMRKKRSPRTASFEAFRFTEITATALKHLQRHSGTRFLARVRNPYSLSWLWIPGTLVSLAPRNDD